MKKKNIQMGPDFYYPDLYIILDDVMVSKKGRVFKINLVFGCMLYHTINKMFRYYLPISFHSIDHSHFLSTRT